MAKVKKDVNAERFYRQIVKEVSKTGNLAVVMMADGKGFVVSGIFHKWTSRKDLVKFLKKKARVEEIEEKAGLPEMNKTKFTIVEVSPLALPVYIESWRAINVTSGFKPYLVLDALTDETQFNRGKGGKSPSAIQKHLRNGGVFMSTQEIEQSLWFLRKLGVVVKTITGAWWPKLWLREVMQDMGFSYLPTIQ